MRQTALRTVYELAKTNPKIVFIGSDLGVGTLEDMRKELPNQFFMDGISEQHLIGFAAGLAKEGYVPFLNTIANFFSRRALEQIILDVSLHGLPVKILASGGGMVYSPLGPTHTATDDLAHMLSIPNLNVFAPCDAPEMKAIIESESRSLSPAYIRFGKGGEKMVSDQFEDSKNKEFKFIGNINAARVIITSGVSVQPVLEAMDLIDNKSSVLIVHVTKLNLRGSKDLFQALNNKLRILVVEEHQSLGGLLTQVLHFNFEHSLGINNIKSISLGEKFVRKYGSQIDHFKNFGITPENIAREVLA